MPGCTSPTTATIMSPRWRPAIPPMPAARCRAGFRRRRPRRWAARFVNRPPTLADNAASVESEAPVAAPVYGRIRWAILALLFASTVLNYVDRQTLSILARTVQDDLGISDLGYAHIVQLFLIFYTLAYLGAGWVTDRLGTRLSLALFIGWRSLAN